MGLSLKCGGGKFHICYTDWNNFRIIMANACIDYINFFHKSGSVVDIDYICDSRNNHNLTSYLCFFIKNITVIENLQIIGIYHLLIVSDHKGFYTYSNSEKILKMIDMVSRFIHTDITKYKYFFKNSFEIKQNIYIL